MTFQTASAGNLCLVQMYTIYSLYWSSQLYSLIFEKKKKKRVFWGVSGAVSLPSTVTFHVSSSD